MARYLLKTVSRGLVKWIGCANPEVWPGRDMFLGPVKERRRAWKTFEALVESKETRLVHMPWKPLKIGVW